MQSTARDFWKMVHDRKSGVIVMLSDLVEGGQVRMVAISATRVATCHSLSPHPRGVLPVLAQHWVTEVWGVHSGAPGGGEVAGLCAEDCQC